MSENNKPWVVDVETIAPFGYCNWSLDESVYKPRCALQYPRTQSNTYDGEVYGQEQFLFNFYQGEQQALTLQMYYHQGVYDWIRRTYDLPELLDEDITIDHEIFPDPTYQFIVHRYSSGSNVVSTTAQERFETEAEAIEYAEGMHVLKPLITFNDGDYLFRASFRQEIEGVYVTRTVGIQHSGDPIEIYTARDLENYYANAADPENQYYSEDQTFFTEQYGADLDWLADANCETSLNITVFNVDTLVSSVITVEPDYNVPGPGDLTLTIVDGDPVVPTTMIENGPGSVTISDNDNILMLNEGGTFFLNEFGNVGFYANGDACLLYTSPSPRDRQKSRMPSSA